MRRLIGLLLLCLFASRASAVYTPIRTWTFDWWDWVGGGGEWYYNYHETGDESRFWGENSSGYPGLSDPPYAFCAEDGSRNAQDYPGDYHCQMQFDNSYSLAGYASALVVFDTYVMTDRWSGKLSLWADRGSGWVKVFETSGWYGYRNCRVGLDGAGSGSSVKLRFRFDSESGGAGGAWVDNVTLYGSSVPLPNLRARDFECDEDAALMDQVVHVTFTLENTSSVGVASVSYGIYLAWWSDEIDPLQDNLLFSETIGGLGPGQSTVVDKWVNVGPSSGSYEIGVYVDNALSLDEGNELDNSSATNINILSNDWYEENDTFVDAKEFSTVMTTEWGLTLTDDDWYYTVVNPGETLSVVADSCWGDLVLELYDSSYGLLDTSALDTNAQICTWRNGTGAPMTCYFHFYSPTGSLTWYDLTVKRDTFAEGYAVVVGLGRYQDGSTCKFADDDATSVANILQGDPRWTQVTLYTNSNATWTNVDSAIWNVLSNAGPLDTVLFYFSGLPGSPQYGGSLLLYDGQEYNSWELRQLNKAGTKDLVVVCDSDRAADMVNDVRWGSFALGLSAASWNETADRLDQLGHGAFTYFFCEALSQAATDEDENDFVTAEEAFAEAKANLALFSAQGAFMEDFFGEEVRLIEARPSDHSLTLQQPTGTDSWSSGTSHRIWWSDTGIGGKVDIFFGRDGAWPSEPVASGVPNTGVCNWLLPGLDASNCRVLVRTDWGAVEDASPIGLRIRSDPLVEADLAIVDVRVEDMGPNAKRVHLEIVNTGDAASPPGTVAFWNNPVLPLGPPDGTQALWPLGPGERAGGLWWDVTGPGVRETWMSYAMVDYTKVIDEEHEDDNVWGPIPLGWQGDTAPRIQLTRFNGGESLDGGVSERITWLNEGVTGAWVMIEFSSDGGGNWTTVAAKAPNTGSYPWTLPQMRADRCIVKLTALSAGCADASDDYFALSSLLPGILGGGCGSAAAAALAFLAAFALRRKR